MVGRSAIYSGSRQEGSAGECKDCGNSEKPSGFKRTNLPLTVQLVKSHGDKWIKYGSASQSILVFTATAMAELFFQRDVSRDMP